MSLLFYISQFFFKFKLYIQKLIDHLLIQFLKMLVWKFVKLIDLVWIIGVYIILHDLCRVFFWDNRGMVRFVSIRVPFRVSRTTLEYH